MSGSATPKRTGVSSRVPDSAVATVHAAPSRAATTRIHCSTRTTPAQTGIRATCRSTPRTASSRRSPISGSRCTEARRTASAQGRPSPCVVSSARARTSESTRARCTGVASGTALSAPRSALAEPPRSSWSFLRGSGRSRPTHETTGQPVARPARRRVERSTASTTVGTPAASAKASCSARTRWSGRARVGASPPASCRRAAAARTSDSIRSAVIFLARTRDSISPRSSSRPMPWRALMPITGTRPSPSASSRRRTSASIASRPSAGTVSMWLSTTTMTPSWVFSGAR